MQNDFVDPKGSLYVKGAEVAVDNMIRFIEENGDKFDEIILSQDSHHHSHIATVDAWEGDLPLFTTISKEEIESGARVPRFIKSGSYRFDKMLKELEPGEKITLWPHHCVIGTWGWCFPDKLIAAISKWAEEKYIDRCWRIVRKGEDDANEEYSLIIKDPEKRSSWISHSQYRDPMFYISTRRYKDETIFNFYIAGVAKDYCVASTVKDFYTELKSREGASERFNIHFIENCMATIDKTNQSLSVYDEMIKNGYADSI